MDIKTYLDNFKDIVYDKSLNTLNILQNNFIEKELDFIKNEISRVSKELEVINGDLNKTTKEFIDYYDSLIKTLNLKINFINDNASIFNKINITYDINKLKDYITFNLYNANKSNIVSKNNYLELQTNYQTYPTQHSHNNLDTITIYNSNSNFHSCVVLESPLLTYVSKIYLNILKTDGTIINKIIDNTFISEKINIEHELVNSLQIDIKFDVSSSLPISLSLFLSSFKTYLSLNNYTNYGNIIIPNISIKKGDYVGFITNSNIKSNTYLNLVIELNNLVFTLPINNTVVVKKNKDINVKEIDKLIGIWIDTNYIETTDLKVLNEYSEKEFFILYKSKLEPNVILNNEIEIFPNGFKLLNLNENLININLKLELITLDNTLSPSITSLIGFTRDE